MELSRSMNGWKRMRKKGYWSRAKEGSSIRSLYTTRALGSISNITTNKHLNVGSILFFIAMESMNRIRRGNASASNRFQEVSATNLLPETALIGIASSKSSIKNKNRAAKLLKEFTEKIGSEDPGRVTIDSSKIVLNLISMNCRIGKPDAMTDESVGALVQGLRVVYEEAGHRGPWSMNMSEGSASGNPLIGNEDIKKLRASHRVHLSQSDRSKVRARPLTMGLVCAHASRFWLGCGSEIDMRDILLHAIMIVGLNLGLRYDEVRKFKVSHITIDPGHTGTGSVLLTITESIKNSTKPREYRLEEWPGNSGMRSAVVADPFVALVSWLGIRGNRPGYLFCTVDKKNMIRPEEAWPVKRFTEFMRERLRMCGVGPGDLTMYSGHSIKRGANTDFDMHRTYFRKQNLKIFQCWLINYKLIEFWPIR